MVIAPVMYQAWGRAMARGTIAKIVRDRGFGFIRGNDGKDVFFHRSGVVELVFEELDLGTTVDFEVEQSPKGPRASNVRLPVGGIQEITE
jgi:CspA family cold shock protein